MDGDLGGPTGTPEGSTVPTQIATPVVVDAILDVDAWAGSDEAQVFGNLLQGMRFAFLLPPSGKYWREVRSGWSTLVALASLTAFVPFVADLLQVGPKGVFSASGLSGVLFDVPVMMLGAWALARFVGRTRNTLSLLVALIGLSIPIEIVIRIVHVVATRVAARAGFPWSILPDPSATAGAIWFTLAATVAAIRLLGAPRRRWLAIAFMIGVLVTLPRTIDRDRTFWWAPYDEKAAVSYERRHAALANEEAFYGQPRLLQQQLAALKPGRRGVIDVYFIGVAAYAAQDVFMKEVHSVAKLFDERFGTRGHSLMLINNPATVGESPIASSTSLRRALQRVSEVMDRDEDILFLFLTSHGSKDHNATFEFEPIRLKPLDPKRLKELLDESGIKRRVVVVSACYSGAFVDALKDDSTLVIAAAAADKTSFGCSNDAEFTYFGKAYFDEALRRTYSFSEAFEIARPVIAQREREANARASDPGMFVGAGIKPVLERFVRFRRSAEAARRHAARE
jgi:peptidase C13-like protein